MQVRITLTVVREMELTLEEDQTVEEAKESWKESIFDDPFSFIDSDDVEVSCSIVELSNG